MSELYLIAHKCRGEPAFDIALQMQCPECRGGTRDAASSMCNECDSDGYWWIIPTSGHRAYPYNWAYYDMDSLLPIEHRDMPPDIPDHYPHATHTEAPKQSLIDRLGLKPKPAPMAPIIRRI